MSKKKAAPVGYDLSAVEVGTVKLSNIVAAYEVLEKQTIYNIEAMDCQDDKDALAKARKLMEGK